MKFVHNFFISSVIVYSLFCITSCNTNTFESNSASLLQNHLSMMMKFKTKTRSMLENLYISANRVEMSSTRASTTKTHTAIKSKHFSSLNRSLLKRYTSKLKTQEYMQYRYKNYGEIVKQLKDLAKKYPDYLKVTTAQKLYNLPYPGGYCNLEKKSKCAHYVAFLSNHKVDKKGKHQIYISGEVHGDERVGPTATIELINLILENKESPWFSYLLTTRYIVLTPMTNPHGYYDKVREELLIKDEDQMVLTKPMYLKTHKDINRDFPYLVKPASCMETIGARVVNELYINHMFSLALSLHGGTESLTYPYGTPNHLKSLSVPKLPVKYIRDKKGKLTLMKNKKTHSLIQKFRSGLYEMKQGKSTNPPDYNALKSIAETASDHTTNNPTKQYKTGDMNGQVYSVTGGMEDWAYSGSWEGAPIVTQPCKPTTYKGYDEKKTMYDKTYKDSLKSIMFLLEVSNDKVPEQKNLGRKNVDCLLNLRSNAFFNKIAKNKHVCLDDYIDGYIPRIIRLSLTLIDLLHPYVTYVTFPKKRNYTVNWTVGGAINVDSTFILYDYFKQAPKREMLKKIHNSNDIKEIKTILKQSTKELSGKAVWNIQYTANDRFSHRFVQPNKHGKFLVFVIVAKVDKNWSKKNHPEPDVNPQTHIANFRTNPSYQASNAGFTIKGQDVFKSTIKVLDTHKLN